MSAVPPYRLAESRYRTKVGLPAGLLIATFLLLMSGNLAGNGVLDVARDQPLAPEWADGSLLRLLTRSVAGWLSPILDQQTALLLVYVMLAALAAAQSYRLLRSNDWPGWQALSVLGLIAGQGMMLLSVTAATPEFLLVLAAGALIPACRRLEAVGDVQAIVNYSLMLPLLLLAGPPLAVLLPVLVLLVPLREDEARQRPAVFGAMLIVAVVPVLIAMLGIAAMAMRAGVAADTMIAPFVKSFENADQPMLPAFLLVALTAPVMFALLVHLVIADRRRKILTTLLALLLPAYLAIGNAVFNWNFSVWLPVAAMLGTVLGWLSATRVRPWLRLTVLGLLLAGMISSWAFGGSWAEASWLAGLMPIHLFGYHLG